MKHYIQFLKGFKKGMHSFGSIIAGIINAVLLLSVYMLGVGLTSLVARLLKKKFLDIRIEKDRSTYWSDLNLKKEDMENYYRQF